MAVNTLASLRANIVDWVARTDITQAIVDNFIDLAEGEIIHGVYDERGYAIVPPLRARSMETYDDVFALSGEFTDLPAGFLGFKTIKTATQQLSEVSNEVYEATYVSLTGSTPKAYAIVGGQIRVGPGAAGGDLMRVVYYKQPDNLITMGANWVLERYPNTYLYGALRHLAFYTAMDSRIAFLQSAFISTLVAMHASEKSTAFAGQLIQRTLGVTTT